MSLNVGSLWGNLTLNVTGFVTGLTQAVSAANTASSQITQAGNRMQGAFKGGSLTGLNQMSTQMNQAARAARTATKQVSNSTKEMGDNFNTAQNKIRESSQNTQKAVGGLTGAFGKLGRETGNIVRGILIAQTFYEITNRIQQTIRDVITFQTQIEQAEISLKAFLGSQAASQAFIANVKDFAAYTPFTFQSALSQYRKLAAVGFDPREVNSIMEIVTDAGIAYGLQADEIDRVIIALGQMRNSSKISAQEIRQLINANIPAARILSEQLGLTADQIQNIGELAIPGEKGVAALIKGFARFKGLSKEMANTLPGILSTISDSFKFIGEQIFNAPYEGLKNFLQRIRDTMEKVRAALDKGGLRAAFQALIPPELQGPILRIMTAFNMLGKAIGNIIKAIGPTVITFFTGLIQILGTVLPPITSLIFWLSELFRIIMLTVPGIQYLVTAILTLLFVEKVSALLATFWGVMRGASLALYAAKAVNTLKNAILTLTAATKKNPIGALVTMMLALALTSNAAQSAIGGVMDRLGKLMGFKGVDILPDGGIDEQTKKLQEELQKPFAGLNENLKDIGKGFGDAADKGKKAGKKIKDTFLASFDEVFQVPDNLDKAGDSAEDMADKLKGISDISIPDVKFKPGELIDTTGDIDNFNPFEDMFPFGAENKEGFKFPPIDFGTAVATVTDAFALIADSILKSLDRVSKELQRQVKDWLDKLRDLGQPWSIPVGIPLGQVVTDWLRDTWERLKDLARDWTITIRVSIPDFAPAFQTVSDFFAITMPETFMNFVYWLQENWQPVLLGTLAATAAVVIAIFGGQIVGAIGAAVGVVAEFLAGLGLSGTAVAAAAGSIQAGLAVALGAIGVFSLGAWGIFQQFGLDVGRVFGDLGTNILTWSTSTWSTITTWATNTTTSIGTWATNTGNIINNWVTSGWNSVTAFTTNTANNITSWIGTTSSNFNTWAVNTGTTVRNWAMGVSKGIYQWAVNTSTNIGNWITTTTNNFGTWSKNTAGTFSNWLNGVAGGVKNWVNSTSSMFAQWCNNATQNISAWARSSWSSFGNWISGTSSGIYRWAKSTLSTIGDWARSAWGAISNLAKAAGEALGGTFNGINRSITNASSSIGSWYDSNKSWAVPVAAGVAALGVAAAIYFSGGVAAPALAPLLALERGGIVDREQLALVGEGNKREVMIPLQNPTYMRPYAQAVAEELKALQGNTTTGTQQPVYLQIGTLIGDERSITELERRLNAVRLKENLRRGLV